MRNIPTEKRECKACGKEYDWNIRNIYGLCVTCRKKHYVKLQRLKPGEYKKPYPLNENQKRVRYRRLQKALDGAETREERRALYAKELEYMIETGIWEWCVDVRFSTVIQNRGSGKRGRKSHKDSKSEYPNTKDWYE